jgi:hypothetical protein
MWHRRRNMMSEHMKVSTCKSIDIAGSRGLDQGCLGWNDMIIAGLKPALAQS